MNLSFTNTAFKKIFTLTIAISAINFSYGQETPTSNTIDSTNIAQDSNEVKNSIQEVGVIDSLTDIIPLRLDIDKLSDYKVINVPNPTSEIEKVLPSSEWSDFQAQAELWKKCGWIKQGIIGELPTKLPRFNLANHGSISWQSQYSNSGSELYPLYVPSGWYSILNASSAVTLASAPFSVSGDLVFQNNQLSWNYSTANISFDYQKLLESFKERLKTNELLKQAGSIDKLPTGVLDSLSKLDDILSFINDPKSLDNYLEANKILDSLTEKVKDAALARADSILCDSLSHVKEKYEEVKALYDKVFALYQKYNAKIQTIQTQISNLEKSASDLESLSNPEVIIGKLHADSLLSKKEQLFSHVKQFNLGSGSVSISPLTVQDFLFKGIHTEVKSKDLYFSGGGGVMETFPVSFLGASFPENFLHRTLAYVTAGEGSPDSSYTHGSIIYLHDYPAVTANPYQLNTPKTDWIASARKKISIGTKYSFYSEVDYSSLVITTSTGENFSASALSSNVFNKSAGEFSLRRDDKGEHESILIRCIGPSYVTLGSFNYIPNTLRAEVEYGTSIFHDHLEATIAAYHERPLNTMVSGYNYQHWAIRAKAQYNFPKNGDFISLSWIPDQVQNHTTALVTSSSVYQQLSLNGFFVYEVFGMHLSSFADVSALFNHFEYGESQNTSRMYTVSLMQQVILKKHQVSIQSFGIDSHSLGFETSQIIVQATDCFQVRKLSLTAGANWTKIGETPSLGGLILGGNFILGKAGMISISANAKMSLVHFFDFKQSQQFITAAWQVQW